MAERVGDLPASLDVGAVGRAMLEAARAAHIGVTVTLVEPTGARIVYMSDVAADI